MAKKILNVAPRSTSSGCKVSSNWQVEVNNNKNHRDDEWNEYWYDLIVQYGIPGSPFVHTFLTEQIRFLRRWIRDAAEPDVQALALLSVSWDMASGLDGQAECSQRGGTHTH